MGQEQGQGQGRGNGRQHLRTGAASPGAGTGTVSAGLSTRKTSPGRESIPPQWRHPPSGTARCPPGPLGKSRPPPAPRTHSVLWTPPVLAWLSTCVRALGRSMATAGTAGRGWGRAGRGRHEAAPASEHSGGCSPGRALPVSPWEGSPGAPRLQRDLGSRREHRAGVGLGDRGDQGWDRLKGGSLGWVGGALRGAPSPRSALPRLWPLLSALVLPPPPL